MFRNILVVIGSRERGRTRSSLFGSVATDLHYHARVPVLVVHGDAAVPRIGGSAEPGTGTLSAE